MSNASNPQDDASKRSTGGFSRWEPPSPEELEAMMMGYTVERLIGRGGMGAVYKGIQKSLDRPVAIKILPPGLDRQDASFIERFRNEAKLMARLNHPTIVSVHDFGETAGGQLFIVMEFVDGTDISRMVARQGCLTPEHSLSVTAHVCDALTVAHAAGIVHRDIKPANVLISRQGQVKVADFGLAKIDAPGQSGITQTGMAVGTPDFLAPEAMIYGSQVDARADLYAVGVMLYQMLTGFLPRGAFKPASVMSPGVDPRFDAIVQKATQMDPADRYQTATGIRQDLDVILTTPFIRTNPAKRESPVESQSVAAQRQPALKVSTEPWTAPLPARETAKKSSAGAAAALLLVPVVLGGVAWLVFGPVGKHASDSAVELVATEEPDVSGTTESPAKALTTPVAAQPLTTVRSAVPTSATSAAVAAWLTEARRVGGVVHFSGTGPNGATETAAVEQFKDAVELAVRKDGWLVRRVGGEVHGVGWGAPSANNPTGVTPFGPFMVRRVTHGDVIGMLLSSDGSFRNVAKGGSQHRPDMANVNAAAVVNIKDHLMSLDANGEILTAKRWQGEELSPPEDFFRGSSAFVGIEGSYVAAQPGGGVRGWRLKDGAVTDFPSQLRDVVDIRAADRHLIFLTSTGRVYVTDEMGNPMTDEVGKVPGNLPIAIAVRIGRGMAAAQRMDGVWVAWGESPELIQQTKLIGPVLDVGYDYEAGNSNFMAWIIPSNPFDQGGVASPKVVAAVNAPPQPAVKPAKQADEVAERLAQMESQFQAAHDRDVLSLHNTVVADLDAKYLAAVNRELNAATRKGALAEAVALREEAQRVKNKERMPIADLDSVPDALKKLRGIYRASLGQLEQDRDAKAKASYERYDQLLAGYQEELTKQQRLDDALVVKAKRDELPAARPSVVAAVTTSPTAGSATAPAPATAPTAPTVAVNASPSVRPSSAVKVPKGITVKGVIDWVYSVGGKVDLRVDGKKKGMHTIADLPTEPFEVIKVTLGPSLSQDVLDDSFAMVSILPDLEEIHAEGDRLKITSLAPLAGLTKLTKTAVSGKDGVQSKELAQLSNLKEMDFLRIGIKGFNGEGFDVLEGLSNLRTLRIDGTGRMSAKGGEAIATLKQLTRLELPPLDRSSQSRFAPIATLPSVESMKFNDTAPGAELLGFVAGTPKLKRLDFAGAADFIGRNFASLKPADGRLVELEFGYGADLTDECISEIVKTLPKLQSFSLDIPASACTSKGLEELVKLKHLKVLEWCQTQDSDMALLVKAPALEEVTVRGVGITDDVFAHAMSFPKLKTLRLLKSSVTQPAVDAFKKERPGIEVFLTH
ncbi:MAG: serine/threonine-protein kinase [Prosthecobacter sp.]